MSARPSRVTRLDAGVQTEELAYVQRLMRPIVDWLIGRMCYFFGVVLQASQPVLSQLAGRLLHRL